jgi:hypothetical protein
MEQAIHVVVVPNDTPEPALYGFTSSERAGEYERLRDGGEKSGPVHTKAVPVLSDAQGALLIAQTRAARRAFTAADSAELARLEAAFEESGGRGVELAERIDALRAARERTEALG